MRLVRPAGRRPASMALAAVATAALVAASAAGGAQAAPPASTATALYLVQTVSEPVANYAGGVSGYAATRPAAGERVDAHSAASKKWRDRLRGEHDAALRGARVDTAKKSYDYGVTFNGFSARLTAAEVARLRADSGVLRVWKSEQLTADTITTRDFLGLTGSGGVWSKQFGGDSHAGEGVIVGIIDSGIWAENPSFAALPSPRPDQRVIDKKWKGTCDAGVEQPIACNNKLIGARYFHDDANVNDAEFLSPRDYNGHGSHTASTSAGNSGVTASINGGVVGTVSGVAPAARIAAYKVLWHNPVAGNSSGGTADIVAAIDAAVADGVDVINYSISGSSQYVVDPAEIAFLNAAAAGVFVSASAGNSGDTIGVSSVAHNSPWLTTVAASTHDRGNTKTVTLGNGATYTGVGVGVAAGPATLIDSTNAGLAGADQNLVNLCYLGTLDPAKVTGKIVLCDRGGNARVEKSAAVAQAGGIGMIQANTSAAQSLNADFHSVPSIHLNSVDGAAVTAYVASDANPTASISAVSTDPVRAPAMAGFSSYGPALAGNGDLLKPDITGPGVDVIAAVSPAASGGNHFNSLSGTSMSAPHIAGVAALIKSKNPKWSPMWIKSAMMTTATTKDNTGAPIQWSQGDATPLNYGSGHVVPGSAFDPGLVYDSTPEQWLQYACGIGQLQLITEPEFCASVGSIDPSDLNYPSIAVGDVPGAQTVTRRVTNISKNSSVYAAQVTAPAGFTVKVEPKTLTVAPGKSKTFKVTITRTTAAAGTWAFGSLTWSDLRNHKVTSPIAVRYSALAAPVEATGTGTSGSTTLSLRTGYAGTLTTAVGGLTAASVSNLAFAGPNPTFTPMESDSVKKVTVTVPAGTAVARFSTFDADVPMGTDVDVFVYPAGNTTSQVASSTGGTAQESVTLTEGSYDVYVHLFAASGAVTMPGNAWVVPNTAAGNLTATPATQTAAVNGPATVTATWTGLTAGVRYLGVLAYGNGSSSVGQTVLSVNG
ncbi:S8 family serine peptidase [Catellatospora sp. NPDC049133]|uniref:S8 family serine peptidase n=1 Tax=Catellatospora sp. NPDC049133 TaxID=3155499 RepID=UPI0033DF1646